VLPPAGGTTLALKLNVFVGMRYSLTGLKEYDSSLYDLLIAIETSYRCYFWFLLGVSFEIKLLFHDVICFSYYYINLLDTSRGDMSLFDPDF